MAMWDIRAVGGDNRVHFLRWGSNPVETLVPTCISASPYGMPLPYSLSACGFKWIAGDPYDQPADWVPNGKWEFGELSAAHPAEDPSQAAIAWAGTEDEIRNLISKEMEPLRKLLHQQLEIMVQNAAVCNTTNQRTVDMLRMMNEIAFNVAGETLK